MSKETHNGLIIYSSNWVFNSEWPTSPSLRQAEKLGVILDISFLPLQYPVYHQILMVLSPKCSKWCTLFYFHQSFYSMLPSSFTWTIRHWVPKVSLSALSPLLFFLHATARMIFKQTDKKNHSCNHSPPPLPLCIFFIVLIKMKVQNIPYKTWCCLHILCSKCLMSSCPRAFAHSIPSVWSRP